MGFSSETAKTTDVHFILVDLTSGDAPFILQNRFAKLDIEARKQVEDLISDTVQFCGTIVISDKHQHKHKHKHKHKHDCKSKGKYAYKKTLKQKKKEKHSMQRYEDSFSEPGDTEEIVQTILKFVHVSDKLIRFCSMLLKSSLYHIHTPSFSTKLITKDRNAIRNDGLGLPSTMNQLSNFAAKEEEDRIPIVILPRTQHGKPFIPNLSTDETSHVTSKMDLKTKSRVKVESSSHNEIDTLMPFNLSHQFPYIGISYYHRNTHNCREGRQDKQEGRQKTLNYPMIGLDIVTFEEHNKRLYATVDMFLEVYKGLFTPWEWSRIHYLGRPHIISATGNNDSLRRTMRNDKGKMREFYIRWAMKEAFTKALGVGLGLDFNSFECHLVGADILEKNDNMEEEYHINNIDNPLTGIWECINSRCEQEAMQEKANGITHDEIKQSSIHMPALVKRSIMKQEDGFEGCEVWDFIFTPLCHEIEGTLQYGCACTCYGPRIDNFYGTTGKELKQQLGQEVVNMHMSSTTLRDLISFHKINK